MLALREDDARRPTRNGGDKRSLAMSARTTMKHLLALLARVSALALPVALVNNSCTDPECADPYKLSMTVYVNDAATGAGMCDVTVSMENRIDQYFFYRNNNCGFDAYGGHPGTFLLSVTRSGFRPAAEVVVMDEGECGLPIPQVRQFWLTPE
jgi:hypothetical protein